MRFKEFVTEADFVNKPAGKIADEIARKLDARGIEALRQQHDAPRPGGRRIGPYPKGQVYPQGDAGASPAELGKKVRSSTPTPGMDNVNKALDKVKIDKLKPDQKASLIKRLNRVLKLAGKVKLPGAAKILPAIAMLGSAGLEWLDPSLKEAIVNLKEDLVGHPVVILHKKIINEQEILNEVQWVLQAVQGFTVTLANPEDPRQTTQLNLADKKVDMTGEGGMITITDDLSPAEKTNLLRRAAGSMIDVNVSNLR